MSDFIYHDIKITLKSRFWRVKMKNLSLRTQRCCGRQYITLHNM